MRNISFSLTERQFMDKSKTVTRRLGWKFLKPGDRLMGCRKCMGLKPGDFRPPGTALPHDRRCRLRPPGSHPRRVP